MPGLNAGDLRILGLRESMLGEKMHVPWPGRGRRRGEHAPIPLPELIASHYAGAHFTNAALPFADALGIEVGVLAENPRIVKFTAPPNVALELRTLQPASGAAGHDPNEPASVLVDLAAAGVARLVLPEGNGLLLIPGRRGLEVTRVLTAPSLVEPLAAISSPVAEWAAAREPWLRDEITRRLARRDPWQTAVATGLFARLAIPVDAALAATAVHEDLALPRRWARALEPAAVETLVDLLDAEVQRLLAEVSDLSRAMACDDPGWRAAVLDLCRARDDLEGVRVLLNETLAAERVASMTMVIDAAANRFVQSLPAELALGDTRLERVAILDPEAWWVRPLQK
jgi:hypothetical protein